MAGSSRVLAALLVLTLTCMMLNQSIVDAQTGSSSNREDGGADGREKNIDDQSSSATTAQFRLKLSTVPDALVKGEDAYLIIQMSDGKGNPVPLLPEIVSISALDRDAISVGESIERIGSAYAVKIRPLKSVDTKITVVARLFDTMLESIDVKIYEPSDRPSRLALSIKPSSISYIGPREGYIAVQLLNAKGEPVSADKDYLIEMGSSRPDLLSVSNMTIRQGSNYAYIQFSISSETSSLSPYITITARHGSMYAEETVRVEVPDGLALRLYVMDMVPAVRGQEVYAFVQLQDSHGNAIYASRDMKVEVKPDGMLLTGGTGVIRKGESMAVVLLYVNTDKTCEEMNKDKSACVGIIATSEGLTSNQVMIELVEPVYIDGTKYMDGSRDIRILPRFLPDAMPVVADGRSKVIGALQILADLSAQGGDNDSNKKDISGLRPVIVPLDVTIDLVSSNRLAVDDTRVTVARGKSAALVSSKVGYDASDTTIYTISNYLDDASFRLNMQGHKGITMVSEPLLSRITTGMDVPYIVYFKDSSGYSSYAVEDMSIRVSSDDRIVVMKGGSIAIGGSHTMIQLRALRGGDATLQVEAVGPSVRYAMSGSISIAEEAGGAGIRINVPEPLLSGSKMLASLEIVDDDGYPVPAGSDVRALLLSSGLSVPDMLVIQEGKHFMLFTAEATNSNGSNGAVTAKITAMVDGFGIFEKDVRVVSGEPLALKLSAPESVKPMEQFDVTLDASYAGVQLGNLQVRWGSDLAMLTNMYDAATDGQGKAMARFIAYREGSITVTARISGYGVEDSTSIRINSASIDGEIADAQSTVDGIDNIRLDGVQNSNGSGDETGNTSGIMESMSDTFSELPLEAEYLLMLPALGGVTAWYVNKRMRGRKRA